MNVLMWHVHGSWMTAFVQGPHRVIVPVVDGRGPDGRGRARTWDWPAGVVERSVDELADEPIDVIVLQRAHEESLCRRWLGGRRAGRDIPTVFVEHNAPQGRIDAMGHPMRDRRDVLVVHVTHFNSLFWDTGTTRSCVIEHGIVDPGPRYSGELATAAVAVNEPVRRGRVTGTDLLVDLARHVPIDLFGMGASALSGRSEAITCFEDLPQEKLHGEMARRRLYLHPVRWTSLGLSLIEAMHLAMPVVALATTEVPEAVPARAGVVSNRTDVLVAAIGRLLADPDAARAAGEQARAAALERFGLERFLADWDRVLEEVTW